MKKRLSILAFILFLVVVILGIPRQQTENATVSFPEIGRLMNAEGRAISYPFLDEIRIGTWTAEWEEGGIAEVRDYSWGRLVFRSMYYPEGQLRLRTQYRENVPYGTWTKYHRDGWVEYRKDHHDSGIPMQEVFYDESGEVVLHILEGEVLVDTMGIMNGNGEAEPDGADNSG